MSTNPYAAPAAFVPDTARATPRPYVLGAALALLGLRWAALVILPGGGDVPEGMFATVCALVAGAVSGAIGVWIGFQLEAENSMFWRFPGIAVLSLPAAEFFWLILGGALLGGGYASWALPAWAVALCAASRHAPLWTERVWTPTALWLAEGAAVGMPVRTHHDAFLIGGRAWSNIPRGAPHGIIDTPFVLAAMAVAIAFVLLLRSVRSLRSGPRGWAIVSALASSGTLVWSVLLLMQRLAENG
jgi:hypothetical protein